MKLLIAFLGPTLVLFGGFGLLTYRMVENSLEDALSRRLIGIAQTTAVQIRPATVEFLRRGDDASRTAQRLRHKLQLVKQRTGVARIMLFDEKRRSRADTDDHTVIGDRYYATDADQLELRSVFRGESAASVLFTAADGKPYKTGYAPLQSETDAGSIQFAIAVQGSAKFLSALTQLRFYLLIIGAFLTLLVIGSSWFVSRRLTRPLTQLAAEAHRIGGGQLEKPIHISATDEVGLLADTMNQMREGLYERDQQLQMMLAGIAHEVRNPLGGIALFAGLLREDVEDQPEQLEMVQRIERELEYLKKVVTEFLDYARHSQPSLEEIVLEELIADVCDVPPARGAKAQGGASCGKGSSGEASS